MFDEFIILRLSHSERLCQGRRIDHMETCIGIIVFNEKEKMIQIVF